MATVVKVRSLLLGQGRPKICVPIVAAAAEEIEKAAMGLKDLPADLAEWRADWYEDLADREKVLDTLRRVRQALGERIPLIFTIRTKKEGGQADLSAVAYIALNQAVAGAPEADILDVEFSAGKEVVSQIVEAVHQNEKKTIISSHDFFRTPEVEEMIGRMQKMQEWDADITKMAVMPKSRKDVLKLLTATLLMQEQYGDRPAITMAMAGQGVISRLSGEIFGSCVTFGCAEQASAPGQLQAEELDRILETIHRSLGS